MGQESLHLLGSGLPLFTKCVEGVFSEVGLNPRDFFIELV
jgi:hypothetical protein